MTRDAGPTFCAYPRIKGLRPGGRIYDLFKGTQPDLTVTPVMFVWLL